MTVRGVQMERSWKKILLNEVKEPFFDQILQFLHVERESKKIIYPPEPLVFNAFDKTPFDKVKVVILGQDPYHGQQQAMGLSFSVPRHLKIPASLKRIYAELKRDLGIPIPSHGDLTPWAEQGVFLLNTILTVEASLPGSHKNIGWQLFTDAVIKAISTHKDGVVFMLWGNFAKNKKGLIDESKHFILEAAHPSPLAGNAFQGCGHFSKANALLKAKGIEEINWKL